MELSWKENLLELKKTFNISRGSYNTREVLTLFLNNGNFIGIGETIQHDYYGAHIEEFVKDLIKYKPIIEALEFKHPSELYDALSTLEIHPFLLSGLDIAAYDLYGKMHGSSIRAILGIPMLGEVPQTSYTISIDTKEKMWEDIQANPWPSYKIKLGTEDDIAIIKYLRSRTSAHFRIDPNCAWTAEQCLSFSDAFSNQSIEFIEQPLKVGDLKGMELLMKESSIPIISDESITSLNDYALKRHLFHGVNLKLTKSGGITPCYRILKEARKDKKIIMFGCMTESSISIAAAASMLPWVDFADLDGTLLIKNDLATGLNITDAKVLISDQAGLGINLIDSQN